MRTLALASVVTTMIARSRISTSLKINFLKLTDYDLKALWCALDPEDANHISHKHFLAFIEKGKVPEDAPRQPPSWAKYMKKQEDSLLAWASTRDMRAALTTAIVESEEASEGELQRMVDEGGGEPSAESIRRMLCAQLGEAAFARAHARLQNVVEEDDDDALVNDLQLILGQGKMKLLPIILKLIFLEEQQQS